MKTVLLLRHGKSDWNAPSGFDAERPLAPRGVRTAALMGRFITEAETAPDLAVTSPAVRARTTLQIAAKAGGWEAAQKIEPGIYGGSAATVAELVRATPDDVDTLLLTGHQPTWSILAGSLIGGGHLAFPTAAVACIDLGIASWQDAAEGRGELRWFVTPRILADR